MVSWCVFCAVSNTSLLLTIAIQALLLLPTKIKHDCLSPQLLLTGLTPDLSILQCLKSLLIFFFGLLASFISAVIQKG